MNNALAQTILPTRFSREAASELLKQFGRMGYISGWQTYDDGPDQPAGERYWGEVFVEGQAAEACMGDDEDEVLRDLARAAAVIFLEAEGQRLQMTLRL